MTVEELIKELNAVSNKKMKVLLAKDPEGNEFHSLYNTNSSFVINEGNDFYELVDEEDQLEGAEEVLVLWP